VPTALIPATAILTAAIMLLLNRVMVSDWQGLMTETRQRLGSPTRPPAHRAPAEAKPEVARATAPVIPPAPDPAPAEESAAPAPEVKEAAPAPVEPPPAPVAEAPVAEAPVAEAPVAKEDADTNQALADIQREAEQRRAEQAELEALRKKAEEEAKANPPRRRTPEMVPFFGRMVPADPAAREAWIRQQAMIERQLLEQMARQRQAAQAQMEAILREMGAAGMGGRNQARVWPPGGLLVPMPPAPAMPFGDGNERLRQWGLPPVDGDAPAPENQAVPPHNEPPAADADHLI
jgi:hypothetical protein